MNLKQRIRMAMDVFRRGYPPQIESFQVARSISLPSDMSDMTDAYQLIPAALAGIRAIAAQASTIPIVVYRRRKGSDEPVPEHPLAQMLHPQTGRFNQWTTAYSGWYATFAYANAPGTSFLAKDAPLRGAPTELHVLRPDWMKIVPGRDRPVLRYEYGPGGSTPLIFQPEEILTLQQFNPVSSVWGQSPLRPARMHMVLQLAMIHWNEEFFENGATLGGVVAFKTPQGPDFMRRQREVFSEEHRGKGNAHKWRFVSGVEEVKELGQGMKDLQFNEGLNATERAVLRCLGVPPAIVGYAEDQSYATAHEQRKQFIEGTIQPLCQLRDCQVNLMLSPAFGRDIYVKSDFSQVDALLPSVTDISTAAGAAFRNRVITAGEYRTWLKTRQMPDLKPTERDEMFWDELGGTETPAAGQGTEPQAPGSAISPAAPAADPQEPDPVRALINEVNRDIEARRWAERREAKEQKARIVQIRMDKHAPKVEKTVLSMFNDQQQTLLDNLAQLSLENLGPVDRILANQRDQNTAAIQEALGRVVKDVGQEELAALVSGGTFNSVSESALRFLAREAAQKVVLIDMTTADAVRQGIRDALLEAQLAGDNILGASDRIMEAGIKAGMEIRRARANMIAQTETNSAMSFADMEAWAQSGVVETRIWNTQRDDKVRDSHDVLDGVEVAIDEPFDVGGNAMMYPGDPAGPAGEVIECRCFLTPGKLKLSHRIVATRSRIAALFPPWPEVQRSNGNGVAHGT